MQNSKEYVKSRGAVVFANNTKDTDYISIAGANARLIDRYLGIPTTIVTSDNLTTNRRLDATTGKIIEWKNQGRSQAYDISPYEETLLIDADYLILDRDLEQIFDVMKDYMLFNKNLYIVNPSISETMGTYSLPFVWATAVFFRKTERAKKLFDLVGAIEKNYSYYRALYNIEAGNFRNDYAFSIAHYILNGYTQSEQEYLPWPLTTVPGILDTLEFNDENIVARTPDKAYVIPKQSIHILSKHYLQTENFHKFIESALA
jgi:hypothetical protein